MAGQPVNSMDSYFAIRYNFSPIKEHRLWMSDQLLTLSRG